MNPNRPASRLALCLATLALSSLSTTPAFAEPESCKIVSTAQVDAALPNYAPWTLQSGGPGGCRFEGEYEGSRLNYASLSFTQQFHPSKAAATAIMNSIRQETEKSFKLKSINLRGAEPGAILYDRDAGGESIRSIFWYVQVGRAIIIGSFGPPAEAPLDTAEESAAIKLLQSAIADTRDPATAQQASKCPYFDDAIIRKLIPGKNIGIERFGENSCMARNERNAVVMLMRSTNLKPAVADNMNRAAAADCTFEPAPALGDKGGIAHHCRSGNPRADAVFFKGDSYFSISLTPQTEPTEKQRADLLDLARFVHDRQTE